MFLLGINDHQYNSGITLMKDGEVLFAINEERLSRKKAEGGYPRLSMQILEKKFGIDTLSRISHIYVTSIMNPPIFVRIFDLFRKMESSLRNEVDTGIKRTFSDFVHFNTTLTTAHPDHLLGIITKRFLKPSIRKKLPAYIQNVPVSFTEHHHAHAACAYYASGFEDALCITADEMGDGISTTVNVCSHKAIERAWSLHHKTSYGYFYLLMTEVLGFTPMRHEGKVTGLAAYGNYRKIDYDFPLKRLHAGQIVYTGGFGIKEVRKLRKHLLSKYSREDIAAWLQHYTEEHLFQLTRKWMDDTKARNLVLAGGLFANVKINQRLSQLESVRNIFIYPNVNDGGSSHGAILAKTNTMPQRLDHVFFGLEYTNKEIEGQLKKSKLRYTFHDDIELKVAQLLSEENVVARFKGKMEWGPRALGNRSILYHTKDISVNVWLNKKLGRSEFMPFAPATLWEDAGECYIHVDKARHAAEFMIITFTCTDRMKQGNPAVVHVDGTARPQLVREQSNPEFYRLLKEYKRITGNDCILNTSFNMHEEPIVCSPNDAVCAFIESGIEYLAIGNYLVEKEHMFH